MEKPIPDYIKYLFNSRGAWIATQVNENVFLANNRWIGWIRAEDQAVITIDNHYFGTIISLNRLYYLEDHQPPTAPTQSIVRPPIPVHTGYPGREDAQDLPVGARDVEL
jgi:hypothetical protein